MLETLYSFVVDQILFGVLVFSIMMLVYVPFNKYLKLESSTSLWFGFFLLLAAPIKYFLEALNPEVVDVVINNSPPVVRGVHEKLEVTSAYSNVSSVNLIWAFGFFISLTILVLLPLIKYVMFLYRSDFEKIEAHLPGSLEDITKSVPVLTSGNTDSNSPFVYGFVLPKICIPRNCLQNLGEKQLEAVLWHEIHHYKNRDNLRNLFCRFVISLFWFFPPVYFVYSILLKAEEYTADSFSIRKMGSAKIYSETLVSMSGVLTVPTQLQTYFFNKQDLKERLSMIKQDKSSSMKLILANGVILLSCLLISCSFVKKEKNPIYEHSIEADITVKKGSKTLGQNTIPLNTYGSKIVMYNKPEENRFTKLELGAAMYSMNMILLEGTFCEGDHKGELDLLATEEVDLNCGKKSNFQIMAEFDTPTEIETENGLLFDITIKSVVRKKIQKVSSL